MTKPLKFKRMTAVLAISVMLCSPIKANEDGLTYENALYDVVKDHLKSQPDPIANAPNHKFHVTDAQSIATPFFQSQIPESVNISAADATIHVLFLPQCNAPDIDDPDIEAVNFERGQVERIWVEIALERIGINDVAVSSLIERNYFGNQDEPNPKIIELNRAIAASQDQRSDSSGQVFLVLEQQCLFRAIDNNLNALPNVYEHPNYQDGIPDNWVAHNGVIPAGNDWLSDGAHYRYAHSDGVMWNEGSKQTIANRPKINKSASPSDLFYKFQPIDGYRHGWVFAKMEFNACFGKGRTFKPNCKQPTLSSLYEPIPAEQGTNWILVLEKDRKLNFFSYRVEHYNLSRNGRAQEVVIVPYDNFP